MQSITTDIAHALILIIPFHGFFLSIWFFFKSGWSLTPNFFLGLLIFVFSSLSLFQIIYPEDRYTAFLVSHYSLLYELLISPFLFLYNAIMIRPGVPMRIYLHLTIIALIFLLFFLGRSISVPIFILIASLFFIINGLYLAGSVRLLADLIKRTYFGWKYSGISEYSGIIVFNCLVACTFIISTLFYLVLPVNTLYLVQVPKALVIYYTYYRILNRADFTN